jgi:hypothetical protein
VEDVVAGSVGAAVVAEECSDSGVRGMASALREAEVRCIYIYICTHTHTHTHACIHVYMYIYSALREAEVRMRQVRMRHLTVSRDELLQQVRQLEEEVQRLKV